METKSRTEDSAMNTTVAVISRMTAILMGFVTRVIFTHTLSENYVGINGLFTDILNVLSLTELGAGTAITYALYRPIAEGNIKKQQQLMKLYQTFYRGTAVCVGVLGLALIPFMDVLMKNRPEVEHLTFIYLLYLANSVLSYLLVYKRTLIEAHQMNYVVLFGAAGSAADCCAAYYGKLYSVFVDVSDVHGSVKCVYLAKGGKAFPVFKGKREGTSSSRGADGTVSEYPRHDDAQAWDGRCK